MHTVTMLKANDIALVMRPKTAYNDNGKTCYETHGWCRAILYDVLKALEFDRTTARIAADNGVSIVTARAICHEFSKLTEAQYVPISNTYGDELTFVIHVISEREGCHKGVVARWASELASKIMEAITEFENSEALQTT